MGAMTAGAACTGTRAWIETKLGLSATAMRRATKIAIAATWVVAAGLMPH
jgi:hypothetical protein